jgi:plasmid stabilization system protein ParE
MKNYKVIFAQSAENDIYASFEWGCKEWGEELAIKWVFDLKTSVDKILKIFPLSQPLAPESDDLLFEIRQMIVGRYRILFRIEGQTVQILHVRGSFVEKDDNP